MAAASKTLDLLVWGSTGFTGKYVARHLTDAYLPSPTSLTTTSTSTSTSPPPQPPPLRWALAGRSLPKLEALRSELSKINPAAASVPLLVASLEDSASLDAAVGSARCVISTAGPYAAIGSEVVASAVRCGTHYADLTAEIPWVLSMHDKHAKDAIKNGVKIVHSAGFDSQPSDLSVFLLAKQAREKYGVGLKEVWTLAGPAKGGFSGGTIESLLTACYENGDREMRERSSGLYCLAEASGATGGVQPVAAAAAAAASPRGLLPRFVGPASTWTAPFVMSFINERVVRRSMALMPQLYGGEGEGGGSGSSSSSSSSSPPPPRVTEGQALPNLFAAALVSSIMGFGALLCKLPPFRALVRAVAPKQGSGPSDELCKGGNWRIDAVGVTQPDKSGKTHVVRSVAQDANRDPGYWGTSRMLVEIGVAMATQSEELERAGCLKGGFLTPATAGGTVLVERLNRAGMRFEAVDEEDKKSA